VARFKKSPFLVPALFVMANDGRGRSVESRINHAVILVVILAKARTHVDVFAVDAVNVNVDPGFFRGDDAVFVINGRIVT